MGIGRDILYGLGAAVSAPVWGASLLRTGKWRTDWAGRFGRTAALPRPERPRILLHAVSVGEVNLVRGLVEELSAAGVEVVIAATTNTGIARATQLYGEQHAVVRYPLDFTVAVDCFLDAVRPDAVGLVELEVWPTFMERCARRDIPVAVLNGRLSARSFKRYKLIRPAVRPAFASLAAAGVQSPDYAQRFIAMGVPADRVHVLDTMKWDTATLADAVPGADALAAEMGIVGDRPLVVAGSTAPGEERLLLDAVPEDVQLMVVPRKPEWFDAAATALGPTVRRRSAGPATEPTRLFLLDTMGELRKAYALADVVVVGRSFVPLYGSDMMEPIALGKPVVIGPNTADFADTMSALLEGEGIVQTPDPGPAIRRLLDDPAERRRLADAGRAVIRQRQGATTRHRDLLLKMCTV